MRRAEWVSLYWDVVGFGGGLKVSVGPFGEKRPGGEGGMVGNEFGGIYGLYGWFMGAIGRGVEIDSLIFDF